MPYGKVIGYTGDGSNGKDINIVLPKNYIFVCGDNRPDSLDSRYFGPINVNQVIGKLAFRIYPFNDAKVF
jgi:signal peptidase I